MRRHAGLLLLLTASFATAPAAGDERGGLAVLPGEAAHTARRLDAADKLAAHKQWADALEEYQRILSEAGDDLVAVSPRHAVQARWVCHARIAGLPAEQLAAYRTRADAQSRKWFEQGAATNDERILRRVVDEAFCSRYGERALDLLGDFAFERGQFGQAERWWRMIVAPADKSPDGATKAAFPELVFPDPRVDVARVRAKQLLARLFSAEAVSDPNHFARALQAYRHHHAKEQGRLAGRQGAYAEILQAVRDETTVKRDVEESATWPTFAGDVGRSAGATGAARRLRRVCFQPAQWRFSLENHARLDGDAPTKTPDRPLSASARNRVMAFYPVIAADHVLVADARSVVAYSPRDGSASVWFDLAHERRGLDNLLSLKLPAPADLRYTLTVAEDRVYARLGVQALTAERDPGENHSYLVCLNMKADAKGRRLRWLASPDEIKRGAVFEGVPVVHDGRVYIAATRVEGGQTITAIQCYPADAESTPRALWRRDVCSTQELRGNERRLRHHLLTLAGSSIVYCSHSGAIVALDADTGRHVWAVRYPTQGQTTQPSNIAETAGWSRDLAPCVYAAGRLFVAPADLDRLLCLDLANGATLWERDHLKIVHLLGVAREKLIFTTPQTIRATDVTTGADLWQMPDVGTFLAPTGRGLLADDLVFWPTTAGLKVLHVDDGRQSAEYPPGVLDEKMPAERLGNLVYADGCLAIAGPEELSIYLAPGRQRAEREAEAHAQPHSPAARLRLALAEADSGFDRRALDNLRLAEELAASHGTQTEPARSARHELLLETAANATGRRKWNDAARHLEAATAPEFSPVQRARAQGQLAQMWTRAADWPRAVAAWQSILDDAALRAGRVADVHGTPQSAGPLAMAEIRRIVAVHGPSAYAPFEQRARKRLEAAGQDRFAVLRELETQYPNAAVTAAGLPELNQTDARTGRFRVEPPTGAEAEYRFSLPLLRAWQTDLDAGDRLLPWSGPGARSLADSILVFGAPAANGGRLTCRDASEGGTSWGAALPFVPTWAGYYSGTVFVGGADGVACMHPADGLLRWTLPAAAPFSAFHLAGPRLFFMEGGQRLFAVDAATGEVLWTRDAPGAGLGLPEPSGRFHVHFFAGMDRLLVQTGGGRHWLLDAATGQLLHDVVGSPRPWPQPPLAMDGKEEHVCVAGRSHRIVKLETRTGNEAWHYDLPHRGTLTGDLPWVIGDAGCIFVLVPRNYGTGVHCLDAANGKAQWLDERLLTTESLVTDQVTMDARALYFVAGNVLHAWGRAEGQTNWTLPLSGPPSDWRIARIGEGLLAWPVAAESSLRLNRGSIELMATGLSHNPQATHARRQSLPIALIDPQTGQLMQRLNFPVSAEKTAARKVPTVDRGPDLLLSRQGLVVGVPGKTCRFVPVPTSRE
jgi:outer membrane protein assembly factor BamB